MSYSKRVQMSDLKEIQQALQPILRDVTDISSLLVQLARIVNEENKNRLSTALYTCLGDIHSLSQQVSSIVTTLGVGKYRVFLCKEDKLKR
jgi:hypothetical protein